MSVVTTDQSKKAVPWLMGFPEHWGISRGKSLFYKVQRPVREQDKVITAFRDGEVTLRKNRRSDGFTEAMQEIGYQGIRVGDLVIHAMDGFAGAIGVSDSDGKSSPVYQVCLPRSSEANPYYYAYLLREMARTNYILALATGIRERSTDFRFGDFGKQLFPVPPRREQDAIVSFLDGKLAEIDRFIANKRRLIELLEKERSAIRMKAVTRGLSASPKLKPSGIFWIPEIPVGWFPGRLKSEFDNFNTRRIPLNSSERGAMKKREFDYYGASGVIDKVDDFIFDEDLILVAEDGANLVLRNLRLSIIATGRYWVNNHAHILRPKRGDFYFLAELLEAIDYNPWISGAAQPKLTKDRLMAIEIPVPPSDEQKKIAEFLRTEYVRIDKVVNAVSKEITLMNEFRTSLIAEAVTGQLQLTG
ncbi:EcoKI restriction-modification system protein HsdS [Rosistilla oblonga]|uniref:restriction endonuclease subunit S n=1 Tax=Rosistilla oblonga TaxID=2527990 RepID=UPI001187CB78|nr:restriction endonuclease subunit S [Rosistilla oblonga]QDV11484.1 EcoKI restriction-modification system protein HsdS [Rosistilla oblonga]